MSAMDKIWMDSPRYNISLKMSVMHTSGSKSFARLGQELHDKNGVVPRRDELFIIAHTHKNGLPSKAAEAKIKALTDAAIEHPEWTEKTLKQGDLMSRVCGKEKNGHVPSIGLGPTPGDLEMPGAQKYRSTKLQMAIEGCRQAELEKRRLMDRLDEGDRRHEALSQQVAELKELLLANSQATRHVHISP